MKFCEFFKYFLLIFLFISNVYSQECGLTNGLRIYNGEQTNRYDWPWLVALIHQPRKEFFCGGSLISAKHVLSAAHCFQMKLAPAIKPAQYISAVVGKYNLSITDEVGSKLFKVWEVILHPDWKYNELSYDADLALIVLESLVDLSNPYKIGIVCLPPASNREVSEIGTIVGWGLSEVNEETSNSRLNKISFTPIPNKLKLPAVKQSICFEADSRISDHSSNRTFCGGYSRQSKAACAGDSGGGFFEVDRSDRYTIFGIISASLNPTEESRSQRCNTEMFSLFTNVGNFMQFIEEKMEETKEMKWKEVEFDCANGSSGFECELQYKGQLKRNLRIAPKYNNDRNIERVSIFFKAPHIFAGLGECFPYLKVLQISYQRIRFIERSNFKNLGKLQRLLLYNNRIEYPEEDAFWDLESLEFLNLQNNNIRELPEKLFNNLTKIKKIWFQNNNIRILHKNLFEQNVNLEEVNAAGNNYLRTIAVDFRKLPKVKFINETVLEINYE